MGESLPARDVTSEDLHLDRPHPARMYDYYLDGKDHFPADRDAAESVLAAAPDVRVMARENRAFMARAIAHLASAHGVRQFLDVGTGIPTSPNLHEIAQSIAPESRVVYADNDPLVLTYARALLSGTPEGRTAYLQADLRDPARILASDEVSNTLDLDEPVELSLLAILHFLTDDDDPTRIIRTLLSGLAPGSFLVLSHATGDFADGPAKAVQEYKSRGIQARVRSHAEITALLDGLDLIDPGLQVIHRWRPGAATDRTDAEVSIYGAVARKP